MHNASIDETCILAERLRVAIEEFSFVWESQEFHVTASFGLAEIGDRHATPADAMRDADSACYAAKQSGRNRIQLIRSRNSRLGKLGLLRQPGIS